MASGDYYLQKNNGLTIDEKIFTAVSGRVLGFDASLNPIMLDVALAEHTHSGYIPYTGGTSDVNLGVHNLTVDTNTLFVDSVNHRVGVGTASPAYKLDVKGTAATDAIRTNVGVEFTTTTAPATSATLTLTTGTVLGIGQYYYRITYYTALGETNMSTISTITTTTGNQAVNLTNIPISSDSRVIGRKIYRTKVGATTDNQYYLSTIGNNTATTYTDTTADASLTGVGLQSLRANTTNRFITVNGSRSMFLDNNLTTFGVNAGATLLTTGAMYPTVRSVYIGNGAGQNITTGSGNVAVGSYALFVATSTSYSTLVGDIAGYALTTGGGNTFIGSSAGRFVATGGSTVILGQAGMYLNDGSTPLTNPWYSVYIGQGAKGFTANDSNAIVIGYNANGIGNNSVVLGNDSIVTTALKGKVGIGTITPVSPLNVVGAQTTLSSTTNVKGILTLYDNTAWAQNVGSAITLGGLIDTTNYYQFGAIKGGKANASLSDAAGYLSLHTSTLTGTLTERVRIDTSGNVGIGTLSPVSKLHVDGTTATGELTVNTTSTSGSISIASLFAPNAAGDTYFTVGRSLSTANSALIGLSSVGSATKYAFLTTYGRPASDFVVSANGNKGMGVITPTAYLHIKAGTATASTAPLKFTSGTNLTSPEAGAMEFNGTNLFFTPSTTRKTIAFTEDLPAGISGLLADKLLYATTATTIASHVNIDVFRYNAHSTDGLRLTSKNNSNSIVYLEALPAASSISTSFIDTVTSTFGSIVSDTTRTRSTLLYRNTNQLAPGSPGDPPLGEDIDYAFELSISDLRHDLTFRRNRDTFHIIGIDPANDHGEIRIGDWEGVLVGLYDSGVYGVSIYADGILNARFNTNSIQLNCSDVYQTLTGANVFRAGSLIYSDWVANDFFRITKTIEIEGVLSIPYITADYSSTAGLTTLIGAHTNTYANAIELYSNGSAFLLINDNLPSPVTVAGQLGVTSNIKIDIATGTSPLLITSTTLCTNLNADLLDGLHASEINKVTTLSTIYTSESNVGTGATTVHSYNMPANVLTADGQRLEVVFSGLSADNTNAKNIEAYFGTTSIATFSNNESGSTNRWYIKLIIVRTSSSTAIVSFDGTWNKGYGGGYGTSVTGLNFTTTNNIELQLMAPASTNIAAKLSTVTHFK